jgi:hypothetical protein
MGAPVLSTPVVANGTIFITTQTHLYAVAEGAKPVAPGTKPAADASPAKPSSVAAR